MNVSAPYRRACCLIASAAAVLFPRSASAEPHEPPLLHLRGSVGSRAIAGSVSGTARVESASRAAFGPYESGFLGAGLSFEIAPGFSVGDTTIEVAAIELGWYPANDFFGEKDGIENLGVEPKPPLRFLNVSFGFARPVLEWWRIGGGFGYGSLQYELEQPGSGRGTEVAGFWTAYAFFGPRWALVSTGTRAQSALYFGLRAKETLGFGLDGAGVLAAAALFAELEFQ